MNRKAGTMVLVTLVLIFAWQPGWSLYPVEEAFTILLCIAVLLLLLFLPVMVLLFLWHGVRFVFLRLKGIFEAIVSVRGRPRVLHGR